EHREGGEEIERAGGRLAVRREIRRARAEDQERACERQNQEADDRTAVPDAERQRGADRGQHAQRWGREQQGRDERRQRAARQPERDRDERRERDQRQAADDPVRGDLREHEDAVRHGGQQQLLERAVVRVVAQQPVEAEQLGEQRRDPQHADADRAQRRLIGLERERKQRRDD